MLSSRPFVLTLMTNNLALAEAADRAGVDRIGIDLDRLGKTERQPANYRISDHRPTDLSALRRVVCRAKLFARTDPPHDRSADQINDLIARGAEAIMLPMFHHPDQASRFIDMVGGRAETILLVETAAAVVRLREVTEIDGVDEITIGLNDLHLDLKLHSRFEIVASDLMKSIAATVNRSGIRFGFGGLGRVDDSMLPVPSSLVYPQYARLGATSALLARSFVKGPLHELADAVAMARQELARWSDATGDAHDAAHEKLRQFLWSTSSIRAVA